MQHPNNPDEQPGWQDTGSEEFVDAWDDGEDEEHVNYDAYYDEDDEGMALLAEPAVDLQAAGGVVAPGQVQLDPLLVAAVGEQNRIPGQPLNPLLAAAVGLHDTIGITPELQRQAQMLQETPADMRVTGQQLLEQMAPDEIEQLLQYIQQRGPLFAADARHWLWGRGRAGIDEGGDGGQAASGRSSSVGSSSGSRSDDEASEPQEDGAAAARPIPVRFDPNVAARHQYLGDVDELEGSYGHLPDSTLARLPLLVLDGVVLFPGCQLPLLLNTPHELHLLDRALAAPPPCTRLLAVLPGPRSLVRSLPGAVCCTAEVRQMRRQGDDGRSVAVLALGRQRAEVVADGRTSALSSVSVNVRILPEGCTSDVPLPMRQGFSPIHPALTRPWDLQLLVARVRQLVELVLLPAASFQGSPLQLSYWVAHNLPLPPSTRQMLLMCSCPADRLRLLLELLQRLDRLCCSACGNQLATTAEVLAMTTEGVGGTYVNSHGYVHEMVTFSKVHGLRVYGTPETAYSWFPGYAWTIAHCGMCGQHMGWRFTASRPDLLPRSFWGLRRPGLLCATSPSSSNGQQADPAEQAAAGRQQQHQLQLRQQGANWMELLLGRARQAHMMLHLRQGGPEGPEAAEEEAQEG